MSSGVPRSGLSTAALDTRRQKFSNAARAPSAPPLAWPSTSTAAFIAPADVPEMPSMRSHGSSSRRSSAPQVKAPCEPPPCSARSISSGSPVHRIGLSRSAASQTLGRSDESEIVLNHRARSDRHAARIGLIELTEHDLVAPDLAEKILEHLNGQLLAGTAPVAKTERREAGIVANRMRRAVDTAEHR